MKGYKALNADWTCRGFKYEVGKVYELPDGETMKMCERGFHFCANPIDVYGYYPFEGTVIVEVEALGGIEQAGTKFVTDKIKIIREFTRKQLQALILDGHHNSGNYNSGDCNSGNYNSGDFNSGIFNTTEPLMRAFNKTAHVTYSEFIGALDYSFNCLLDRIENKSITVNDVARIKSLPNFDADIFKQITGIELEDDGKEET